MTEIRTRIENIPTILWGNKSDSVYIYVHGNKSSKEEARHFAEKANQKGYQVLSFDLPEHGERMDDNYPCVVWNGVNDLKIIGQYVQQNWNGVYLFSNSLGAYFSLLAYKDFSLRKCLFLSPILDMERLIQNMMKWFSISEQELMEKREIPTQMGETLNWKYYCYAKENPIEKWSVPTAILYGSKDNLTEQIVVENFSKRFNCDLTVLDGGEHWFRNDRQLNFLGQWLDAHIN